VRKSRLRCQKALTFNGLCFERLAQLNLRESLRFGFVAEPVNRQEHPMRKCLRSAFLGSDTS
jgi:hypothetical protein